MRLLYAEDEKSLARAVSTILTRNNYAVDTVSDGESALEFIRRIREQCEKESIFLAPLKEIV